MDIDLGKIDIEEEQLGIPSDLDKAVKDEPLSPRSNEGRQQRDFSFVSEMLQSIPFYEDAMSIARGITYDCIKEQTRLILDLYSINLSFDDVLMIMTLFVLFASSIMTMATPLSPQAEAALDTINSVCMFFFCLELLMNTWSKTTFTSLQPLRFTGYLLTFYWWLDLIAIVSMWFDITWIAAPLGMGDISSSVSGSSNLAKAGRVVRLVRLVRLVKLFKIASEKRKRQRQEEELIELVQIGAIAYEDIAKQRALSSERKSKLGGELSESTTKRVIVIVLFMVCVLPLLTTPTSNLGPDYSLQFLQAMQADPNISPEVLAASYDEIILDLHTISGENYLVYLDASIDGKPLPNATLYGLPLADNSKLRNIRDGASSTVDFKKSINGKNYFYHAIFNLHPLEYELAMDSVLMTIFIGLLLVVGSLVFTNDTEVMVIKPIGMMMNMIEEVARDPLAPLHFDHSDNRKEEYETRLLEVTIEKITGLLRVGFGEAGAGIISANLKYEKEEGGGAINPLLPGVRVYAIVGFCDIHRFEFVNQQLAADVLIFVNVIAEIVHSRVHYWGGRCNKNLGNAFVIIWRIGDEETLMEQISGFSRRGSTKEALLSPPPSSPRASVKKQGSNASSGSQEGGRNKQLIDLRRVPGVDVMADKALIGYLKIIAEINRSPIVLGYRNEPRLTHSGKEEFQVRMGFGLHAGWAIEGAVGSLKKVDATYLSPHVNMAARLETSSRQYGVPILISHFTHELFSQEVQQLCRRVDVCTVKGSEVPIGVFTYDCLQERKFADKRQKLRGEEWCPEDGPQVFAKKNKKKRPAAGRGLSSKEAAAGAQAAAEEPEEYDPDAPYFGKASEEAGEVFESDCDLLALREHVDDAFLKTFTEGVNKYIDGKWPEAKGLLETANKMMADKVPSLGGDGPCLTLLEYINEFGPAAPSDWKGYRPLTSK